MLGGVTELEIELVKQIRERCELLHVSPRDHLTWYTSATEVPDDLVRIGQHYVLDDLYAYGSHARLRTYLVESADAVIAIGGGKGVSDSVEKARLINKPFFPVPLGGGESQVLWKLFLTADLSFCSRDAFAQLGDQNLPPDETIRLIFAELRTYWSPSRPQVFIVLGRRSGQVLLLYKGALDLPSDISGIATISIDAGIGAAAEDVRRELAGWL